MNIVRLYPILGAAGLVLAAVGILLLASPLARLDGYVSVPAAVVSVRLTDSGALPLLEFVADGKVRRQYARFPLPAGRSYSAGAQVMIRYCKSSPLFPGLYSVVLEEDTEGPARLRRVYRGSGILFLALGCALLILALWLLYSVNHH